MKTDFTIGVLARRAGVNVQTIHYYERKRLLSPAGRTESGYRLYNEESLKRLRFIRRAKEIGFTLREIKGLLDLSLSSASACRRVKESTGRKLRDVEEKIKSLIEVREVLKELLVACERRRPTEKCPILKTIASDDIETRKGD